MAPEGDPDGSLLGRFLALRRWLSSLDVCWSCQDTLAWCQIERERGTKDVRPIQECKTPERCRERANAGRKSMPK